MTNVQVGAEGDLLTIRVDLAEVARDFARQLMECQRESELAHQRWKESEWFLGEARATIAGLEAQLLTRAEAQAQLEAGQQDLTARLEAAQQDLTARLQEAELQRDEAGRSLDELRRAYEELLRQTTSLTDELAQANARIEAMAQGDLEQLGVRAPGERRRASRARRADITVEIQRPDGAVLFQGPLRDISRTGMGFACDQLGNGAPELLWVTLHPNGLQRPIEAIARLAWLRQEDGNGSYAGGYELLDVSPGSRGAFEEVLEHSA
ncbi:MAG TPA: PilZ domain-containing protein [Methylomirabilota bacterium]|nr:PilZ domain-containing protein [Methylomirabilota bacterium]